MRWSSSQPTNIRTQEVQVAATTAGNPLQRTAVSQHHAAHAAALAEHPAHTVALVQQQSRRGNAQASSENISAHQIVHQAATSVDTNRNSATPQLSQSNFTQARWQTTSHSSIVAGPVTMQVSRQWDSAGNQREAVIRRVGTATHMASRNHSALGPSEQAAQSRSSTQGNFEQLWRGLPPGRKLEVQS